MCCVHSHVLVWIAKNGNKRVGLYCTLRSELCLAMPMAMPMAMPAMPMAMPMAYGLCLWPMAYAAMAYAYGYGYE